MSNSSKDDYLLPDNLRKYVESNEQEQKPKDELTKEEIFEHKLYKIYKSDQDDKDEKFLNDLKEYKK